MQLAGASTAVMRVTSVMMTSSLTPREARWKPGEVAPAYLTGELAGDVGFDPLVLAALAKKPIPDLLTGGWPTMNQRSIIMANLSPEEQLASVEWMRAAELKHARLAMLAAVGWPLAELINPWLGATGGRAPSVLNGGLFDGVIPFFLVISLMAGALMENKLEERLNQQWRLTSEKPTAGDFGFDPIGFYREEGAFRQKQLRAQELFNGRLAMLAITGFAAQEFLWGKPVVELTPFFFGR